MHCINLSSFNCLLSMLRKDISVDGWKSRARTGTDPIVPEIMLHCTLRYLAGGSFHDIRTSCGLSKTAFYGAGWKGVNAILACVELSFLFPKDLTTIRPTTAEFTKLSRGGALNGNVGCIDEWLCRIRVPSATESIMLPRIFLDIINTTMWMSKQFVMQGVDLHMCPLLVPAAQMIVWLLSKVHSTILLTTCLMGFTL